MSGNPRLSALPGQTGGFHFGIPRARSVHLPASWRNVPAKLPAPWTQQSPEGPRLPYWYSQCLLTSILRSAAVPTAFFAASKTHPASRDRPRCWRYATGVTIFRNAQCRPNATPGTNGSLPRQNRITLHSRGQSSCLLRPVKHADVSVVSELQLPACLSRAVLPDGFKDPWIILGCDFEPQASCFRAQPEVCWFDSDHGGAVIQLLQRAVPLKLRVVVSQLECRAAPWGGQAGASPGPTSHIRTLRSGL